MYRIMSAIAFLGLSEVSSVHASKPMDEYEQKMSQAAQANRVFELPEATVLHQKLSELGMAHFLEKTGLHKNLSKKNLKEMGIYLAVELAYSDYYSYLKKDMPVPMLEMTMITASMNKPLIIDGIIGVSKVINNGE